MLKWRKNEENIRSSLTWFARFLFVCLLIFELLNVLKIIQFNLQFTWVGLLITASVCWGLLEYIAYKYAELKGHMLHWSVWYIAVIALSLDAAGDFFFLYANIEWWDKLVHFSVPATLCFTLFTIISAFWIDKFKFALLFKTGRLKLSLLLAATSTMSLSALYEVEEYTEDLLFYTNRLGPGTDTADDLMYNFFGTMFVMLIIIVYYKITHKRKIIE